MMDDSAQSPQKIYSTIFNNIEKVIHGQSIAVRKLLAGLISNGHVLLEDYPGTGKTTLAKALARSADIAFKRIQFTPDLLPSDILGVSIYDQQQNTFRFHEGPIFADIVLADEINRASPRTQSALLEAMAEGQVSIDGQLRTLSDLFFVVATQNPVESHGTYPLPEAQMDRFSLKFKLGYVSAEEEVDILSSQEQRHPIHSLTSCVTSADILFLKKQTSQVKISPELQRYCVDICANTRSAAGVLLGASPRGSLALMNISKAMAMFDGMDFVTPEYIQQVAVNVLAHRLVLDPQARFSGASAENIVEEILNTLPVPA